VGIVACGGWDRAAESLADFAAALRASAPRAGSRVRKVLIRRFRLARLDWRRSTDWA
jgi:hypothetical protein